MFLLNDVKKIGVLISGGGSNLQVLIDAVESKKIQGKLSCIISNHDKAYGLERGKNHSIPCHVITEESELITCLNGYELDLIVLAGFTKILKESTLEAICGKIINVHPSLIPAFCGKDYYGMKVHKGVYDYGAKVTGATVHFVTGIPDGGPIIRQKSINIEDEDTPEKIQKKVLKIEHEILPEVVQWFCENRIKVVGRRVNIEKKEV